MGLTPASMHMLESWTIWAYVDVDSLLSKLALVPVMCSHVNCKHRDSLSNLHNQEEYIYCCLVVNPDVESLQTICDDGDGWDAAVPMVPFTALAGVKLIAGSTYHGGPMPHITLPPPLCQQISEARSSPVESVSRSHSAPQLGKQRKRKGAIDWCKSSTMQPCPLHRAQANFRKSLRRGFLSPLAALSNSEEHFSPCEARGGHPASSQVTPCTV